MSIGQCPKSTGNPIAIMNNDDKVIPARFTIYLYLKIYFRVLFTAGADSSVKSWNIQSGQCLKVIVFEKNKKNKHVDSEILKVKDDYFQPSSLYKESFKHFVLIRPDFSWPFPYDPRHGGDPQDVLYVEYRPDGAGVGVRI